jgi:hypothetical protein
MKKISFVFFLASIAQLPAFGQASEIKTQQLSNRPSEIGLRFVSPLTGWVAMEETAQNYDIGADSKVQRSGKFSAYAKSKPSANSTRVAVIRQSIRTDQFRGQRVRLSGWIKADQVAEWAGLWLRIDGENGYRLSLDNMQNRPIKGTSDWRLCELVLDVPEPAVAISFGLVLAGQGQVWMDDLKLEKVSFETPSTERYGKSLPRPGDHEYNRRREAFARRLSEELMTMPLQPVNVDFERP